MKTFFTALLMISLSVGATAQSVPENGSFLQDSARSNHFNPIHTNRDSILFYPALPTWEHFSLSPLHQGLNSTISLYASFGIGHNRPKGVGFGKDINLAYANSLSDRWRYTLAANMHNMKWGSLQWNQMTIGGELNYAHSDQVSFSIMGYKELVHPDRLSPYYYHYHYASPFMMNLDSYVGGAVNFKFNDNFFMQVSIGTGTVKDW